MALPVEAWDPELFQDLQQLLTRISTQPTTSTIRRFAAKLDDASPWITSLTHFPGPNDAEKQALERGEPVFDGIGSEIKLKCVFRTARLAFWLVCQSHWTSTRAHEPNIHSPLALSTLLGCTRGPRRRAPESLCLALDPRSDNLYPPSIHT